MQTINKPIRISRRALVSPELAVQLFEQAKTNYGVIRDWYGNWRSQRQVHIWAHDKTENMIQFCDNSEFAKWDKCIEAGKSYMVGDHVPTAKYLKTHTHGMRFWQRLAYIWAINNPTKILNVQTERHEWDIYQRGEYVELGLPHHGKGGERHYISQTGKTMVLVNVD